MCGRIQMRSVMLQHPQAACEVAVFLNARVDLGFEEFFVSRPRHQLIVDRVTQVEQTRLPGANAFKHRIVVHVLRKERSEDSKTNDKNTGAANRSHLSPQSTLRQRLSGDSKLTHGTVTVRARGIKAEEFPASRQSRPCAGFPDTPG